MYGCFTWRGENTDGSRHRGAGVRGWGWAKAGVRVGVRDGVGVSAGVRVGVGVGVRVWVGVKGRGERCTWKVTLRRTSTPAQPVLRT